MRYQLKRTEIVEPGVADVRICNEFDEPIVTFIFPDDHEAYIARALMVRALAKAVLIIPHTSVVRENRNPVVVRENRNPVDEVIAELNRLSSQLSDGAPRLSPPEKEKSEDR